MEETAQPSGKATLPVILAASLVEGWGLYGLHHAVQAHQWPATDLAWLIALYAVVVFGPLTVQLLAGQVRNRFSWVIVGAVTGIFFYLGWHQGATQLSLTGRFDRVGDHFAFAVPLTVLWLLMLPFIQGRLAAGRWGTPYVTLFADAWRNKLALAEAALFTGLLWLLLELWQSLFHMLKIEFFSELFDEPIFVYPVTAITFGIALHLIGSIERLTSVVLEQLLNVLKWLAIVAGTLLTLFTAALALKLPDLVFSGARAIGAVWLLWLVAVIVLLLNAAYRDGSASRPYPGWIAAALRFTVPLTVVISVTAIYALIVRTQHYGITVERVWGYIVAAAALIYSVGYSIAAFSRGPWMGRIARVNVVAAIALMLVIAVTLTPALAPQRLAANSQLKLILSRPLPAAKDRGGWGTAFGYLRFQAGSYGLDRLKQLAVLQNHPEAEDIRALAKAEMALTTQWQAVESANPDYFRKSLAKLPIYPTGRALEPALVDALVAAPQNQPGAGMVVPQCAPDKCVGVFVDLDGDDVEEFILLDKYAAGSAFAHRDGKWMFIGRVWSQLGAGSWDHTRDALAKGEFSAVAPRWKVLSVGGRVFRLNEEN
jgi:Domain of unknown function (DUF4153)